MLLCRGALSIGGIHCRGFQGAETGLRSERPRRQENASPPDNCLHLRRHPHRNPVNARLRPLQLRADELQPLRLQHQIEIGVWRTHQIGQPDPELTMRLSHSASVEFFPRLETRPISINIESVIQSWAETENVDIGMEFNAWTTRDCAGTQSLSFYEWVFH